MEQNNGGRISSPLNPKEPRVSFVSFAQIKVSWKDPILSPYLEDHPRMDVSGLITMVIVFVPKT